MHIIVRGGSRHAKDAHGDRVDFKEPYFDKGLRRRFETAEEKSAYMRSHDIVSTGESDYDLKRRHKQEMEKIEDEKRR